MSGKNEIDKVRSANLLTNYEASWVQKPTSPEKIMARKKELAEENRGQECIVNPISIR